MPARLARRLNKSAMLLGGPGERILRADTESRLCRLTTEIASTFFPVAAREVLTKLVPGGWPLTRPREDGLGFGKPDQLAAAAVGASGEAGMRGAT
jgi:hypothetical protein